MSSIRRAEEVGRAPIWVMKRTSRPSWIASMASEQAMDTAVSKSSSPA